MKKIGLMILLTIFTSVVLVTTGYTASEHEQGKAVKGEKGRHACYQKAGVHRGGYIHTYIGMYKEHGKELGLSKEQIEKLQALDSECSNTCNKLSGEIEAIESEIDAMVKNDAIDMKTIADKIKAVHELKGKLEVAHFELLSKAQAVFTPEQREKCRKLCVKKTGKEWPMIH